MAMYESEHTKFMREWMAQHPQELIEQQKGRALWWDKAPQDTDTQRRLREARVPANSYYYDAN